MRTDLTKSEQERLFTGAADEALADRDAMRLNAQLDASAELKGQYGQYMRTIALLKDAPREKAPAMLSSLIMRRVKRRRNFERRNALLSQAYSMVPAQVLIPVLLGVLVALFLFFAAP